MDTTLFIFSVRTGLRRRMNRLVWYLLLGGLVILPGVLSAQAWAFNFTNDNGNDKQGAFGFNLKFNGNQQGGVLDLNGQSEGVLQITIHEMFPFKRRFRDDYMLVFPAQVFDRVGNDRWKAENPQARKFAEGDPPLVLTFKIYDNGRATFSLPFGIVPIGAPVSEWKVTNNNSFQPAPSTLNVVGLPTAEDRFWNQSPLTYAGMVNYLTRFPAGREAYRKEAEKIIGEYLAKEYNSAKIGGKKDVEKFVATYLPQQRLPVVAAYLEKARLKIESYPVEPSRPRPERRLTTDPKTDEEKKLYEAASASGEISQMNEYLEQYPEGEYREAAQDSLISWRPAGHRVTGKETDEAGEWVIVELLNFKAPVYTDVYEEEIEVDGSRLAAEQILRVRLLKAGDPFFIVRDTVFPHKIDTIRDLRNPLIVEMTLDSAKQIYHFDFIGGVAPYHLKLLDENDREVVWERENIMDSTFQVSVDELAEAGAVGNLEVMVYSAGASQGVAVSDGGYVFVPKGGPPILLIVFGGLLALGGLIYLILFIRRNRNKRHDTIFDEE